VPVLVGGVTAASIDFARVLSGKLPLFFAIVILLSALLLFVVFRSIVIPIQAAIMNLLTIGAALGVTVAVFQWGWFGSLLGVQKGPIEPWIPVVMFAVVFGLSMDYEVFLVSRIREQWLRHADASAAVGDGIALTGRVITAAAAIRRRARHTRTDPGLDAAGHHERHPPIQHQAAATRLTDL
jgi:RND superfamily putative drug exporter